MREIYVISNNKITKVGFSSYAKSRMMSLSKSIFDSKFNDLFSLSLETNSPNVAEKIMKDILSEQFESAGGVHPTETFFVDFDTASAIARHAKILAEAEILSRSIGYRMNMKGRVLPLARTRCTELKIALIMKDESLTAISSKAGISRASLYSASSGRPLNKTGMEAMCKVAKALDMKVSELVALGEDK